MGGGSEAVASAMTAKRNLEEELFRVEQGGLKGQLDIALGSHPLRHRKGLKMISPKRL